MSENQDIKQRILLHAQEMFNEFGVSKVTMEELAADLGISKKTLYKYFSNKEHLLRELVHDRKCEISKRIGAIVDNTNLPFVEKLKLLLSYMATISNEMNPRMRHQIMRLYPDLWQEISEFRRKNALIRVSRFIKEGAEQGIIRNDINLDLISLIYIGAIHSLESQEGFEKLTTVTDSIHADALKVIYEGILSEKGRNEILQGNVFNTPKENDI